MDDIYIKLIELLKSDRTLVLATIIHQTGSSPRGVGTKCLIMDDGSLIGTIGGGIIEARTIQEAKKVLESGLPARIFFSLDGSDIAGTDMLCGGRSEIFLELISPDDPGYVSIFQEIANIKGPDENGLLATVIDTEKWQKNKIQKVFIKKNGDITGSMSVAREYEDALVKNAGDLLKSGEATIFRPHKDEKDLIEIFVEPILSPSILYVFGCGHVSREITPLANHVGFNVVVIDDRPDFADPAYFPEAMEVRLLDFKGVMNRLAVDESSYLLIVTRGHTHDITVLTQALKTKARYIGMIGSRRKTRIIYDKLLEQGFTMEDLNRVYAPVGIDIGAETPAEIAVSIVAELIMVRSGNKANAGSLKIAFTSHKENH